MADYPEDIYGEIVAEREHLAKIGNRASRCWKLSRLDLARPVQVADT